MSIGVSGENRSAPQSSMHMHAPLAVGVVRARRRPAAGLLQLLGTLADGVLRGAGHQAQHRLRRLPRKLLGAFGGGAYGPERLRLGRLRALLRRAGLRHDGGWSLRHWQWLETLAKPRDERAHVQRFCQLSPILQVSCQPHFAGGLRCQAASYQSDTFM
jgi:hypothetical protein